MVLFFPDRQPFATGATEYTYRPAHLDDQYGRIMLQVEIEGLLTEAAVDTGAPYFICEPHIAEQLSLDPRSALLEEWIGIRGHRVKGSLYRLNIALLATQGDSLDLEVTVFIPHLEDEQWGLPSYIGLVGCLEWVRFAVDPVAGVFYFGPCP